MAGGPDGARRSLALARRGRQFDLGLPSFKIRSMNYRWRVFRVPSATMFQASNHAGTDRRESGMLSRCMSFYLIAGKRRTGEELGPRGPKKFRQSAK